MSSGLAVTRAQPDDHTQPDHRALSDDRNRPAHRSRRERHVQPDDRAQSHGAQPDGHADNNVLALTAARRL
jgi:hypothetical protein